MKLIFPRLNKTTHNTTAVPMTPTPKRFRRFLAFGLAAVLVGCFFLPISGSASYWPGGPEVTAEAAIVMEASTGTILYEKNIHEQLYPASITKILTTLIALENSSLDEEVTFSSNAVYSIESDSSHISRDVGEIMTMEQTLYAVMLASANECAYAVAEHVGGTYSDFIDLMNEYATTLGCVDSHFNNAHGLPDSDHYTSAYDMALISRAAILNDTFRAITGTKTYVIPYTNKHTTEETYLVNHHKMLTSYKGDSSYLYEYCIGGKTGYTSVAKNTLVTFAKKDGMTLICVVMKDSSTGQYTDTKSLLEYCFSNFSLINISENLTDSSTEALSLAGYLSEEAGFVSLDSDAVIVLPTTASFSDATYTVAASESTDAVATLEFTYDGRSVGSADLILTGEAISAYPFTNLSDSNTYVLLSMQTLNYFIAVLLSALALAFLFSMGWWLHKNLYKIRRSYNMRKNRKSRYKRIRKGKHTRWFRD